MTRALYTPGRDRLPDGNALPTGYGEDDREQRQAVREQVTADTPPSLWWQKNGQPTPEYDEFIDERLRTMTLAERIDVELRLIERQRTFHEFDYYPLRY